VEHELDLLAAIFSDPDVIQSHAVRDDWFQNSQNRRALMAVKDCTEAYGFFSPDLVDQSDVQLKAKIEEVLDHPTPFPESIPVYVDRLENRRKSIELRLVLENAQESLKSDANAETIADGLLEAVTGLLRASEGNFKSIGDVIKQLIPVIEERYKAGGGLPGISTGIAELDEATMGLQDKRLYYVAARPSDGKSALLMQIALEIAKRGTPVGFFSLESAEEEFGSRSLAHAGRLAQQYIASGDLDVAGFAKLTEAVGKIKDLPLYIDDKSNAPLEHIIRQSRVMVTRHKVKAIFVDYVQLIKTEGETKRHIVETASHALKDIARNLGVPVVAAAQLNRNADGRAPALGDFQHSSALEQDADTAILMEWLKNSDGTPTDKNKLHIAKNRDGSKGVITLQFIPDILRFQPISDLDRYRESIGA